MPKEKAWIAWSSGKDSAWALHVVRRRQELEVVGLLATITEPFDRVSMHGVRSDLLDAQSRSADLPLRRVLIPAPCSGEQYDAAMREATDAARAEGVTSFVFGDLFLPDVRAYREAKLAQARMRAVFPLWDVDTAALARDMIRAGLRARVTCLDPRRLPRHFAGREFDAAFLADLPAGVDPCGENGEFHTFAWAGPMFDRPIEVAVGETVERDGFVFTDLLPAAPA